MKPSESESMQTDPQAANEIRHADLRLDPARGLAFRANHPVDLTGSEFRVLAALASEPGKSFSRQALIRVAIGERVVVSERTIDVHIAALRRKLGPPEVIETVRRQGYRVRAVGS